MLDRGARGSRTLAADDLRSAPAHIVEDQRNVAARSIEVRLDNLESEGGRDPCVEGASAALENPHSDCRCDPVRRRDDPEGAIDFRTRGETARIGGTHAIEPDFFGKRSRGKGHWRRFRAAGSGTLLTRGQSSKSLRTAQCINQAVGSVGPGQGPTRLADYTVQCNVGLDRPPRPPGHSSWTSSALRSNGRSEL